MNSPVELGDRRATITTRTSNAIEMQAYSASELTSSCTISTRFVIGEPPSQEHRGSLSPLLPDVRHRCDVRCYPPRVACRSVISTPVPLGFFCARHPSLERSVRRTRASLG